MHQPYLILAAERPIALQLTQIVRYLRYATTDSQGLGLLSAGRIWHHEASDAPKAS